MEIDWQIVSNIGGPLVALFAGAWVERRFRERARLVTFYGHVAAFRVRPDDGNTFPVFTHSLVIRNAGRRPATNVRISHNVFPPNVTVFPEIEYNTVVLPDGGREIVFPTLVPNEQVTISYLYFPPVTYEQVNTGVKYDEGFARVVKMLPSEQPALWIRRLGAALMVLGAVSAVYIGYALVRSVVK